MTESLPLNRIILVSTLDDLCSCLIATTTPRLILILWLEIAPRPTPLFLLPWVWSVVIAVEAEEREAGKVDSVIWSAFNTMVKDFKSFNRLILVEKKRVQSDIRCCDKIWCGKVWVKKDGSNHLEVQTEWLNSSEQNGFDQSSSYEV